MYYKIPTQAIIHELLDNEVILANLDSGIYYSIRESGILIWQMLIAGKSFDFISKIFTDRYQTNVADSIRSFVDRLLGEELLISTPFEKEASSFADWVWPEKYIPPIFERYEEMKNLLMLDPIHEVDEQGWPSRSS